MSCMEEHWKFLEQGEANEFCIVTDSGKLVISFRQNGELMLEKQRDIAKHIVSSVNACAGLDQYAIDGGWTAIGMSKYAKSLGNQRNAMQKTIDSLTDSLCEIGDMARQMSTGPAIPDVFLDIRRIAYDAMEAESRADTTSPSIKAAGESK